MDQILGWRSLQDTDSKFQDIGEDRKREIRRGQMKNFKDLPNPCLYEERYTKISEPQNIQVGILQFCFLVKARLDKDIFQSFPKPRKWKKKKNQTGN